MTGSDRMTCGEALDLAKRRASKGFHAFPIAISWDDRKQATNKRPLTDNGFYDATTDPAVLDRLFNAKSPRPGEVWGVGIWPGPSGFLVLDPDIKNGEHGDDELAALEAEHGPLDTLRAVTASGGGHVYLRKPEGVHIGNDDLAPGVNVRADLGYVVAIGTYTPWGSWDHDEATPRHAILCPRWLLERLASTNGGSGGGKGRWAPLDRSKLHPADLACLEAAERLGGHDAYVGGDGYVMIVSPHKTAGGSASIGHIGPGVMKVFTDGWEPLQQNGVYDVDQLAALANPDSSNDLLAGLRDGAWLDAQEFPPLRYHLPGVIPEGSNLLVGPPKIGKSWFVLALALAAADGGVALGQQVDARPVFYLALEDGHRRLQDRCRTLLGTDRIPPAFEYLTIVRPGMVVPTIEAWLTRHPGAQPLVVLDTLGKVMPAALMGESTYQRDYRVGTALKQATDEQPGSALVTNHHDRKAHSEDFVDRVSGTNGLAGAADTIIVLARARHETNGLIQVTGRDVAEGQYAVTFDGPRGLWSLEGDDLADAATAAIQRRITEGLDDRSRTVIDYVDDHPEGVRWGDVKRDLGEEEARYLSRLHASGRIARPSRGLYLPLSGVSGVSGLLTELHTPDTLSESRDLETDTTDTTDTSLETEAGDLIQRVFGSDQ